MQENELIELVEQVTVLMEKYQRNTEKVSLSYSQSTQKLQHVVENCPKNINSAITTGLTQFQESSQLLSSKLLTQFQSQVSEQQKLNKILAWKSIVSVAAVGLALSIGMVFLLWHYIGEVKRYQVASEVLKLYQNSDVTRCENRLCGKLMQNGKKGDYVPIELK